MKEMFFKRKIYVLRNDGESDGGEYSDDPLAYDF